ncbi:MAG TPA: ABC transporter permease [Planctomycetota bacterium]
MPIKLLVRNLLGHPVRSLLTVLSVAVALALLCVIDAAARGFTAAVDLAAQNRLVVWSRVSLFVPLPIAYEQKIRQVEGVADTTKFQWFGGFYRDRSGFFAQFAVDADRLQTIYPELAIVDGDYAEFKKQRDACVIGKGLAARYGWKVGDNVPLISALFPRGSSGVEPWTFTVRAIYDPSRKNFDDQTMFFHFDYVREALEQGAAQGLTGVGTYSILLRDGARAEDVIAAIDALFENGPQRVRTSTEAEFNRQFMSMMGNIPLLLRSIGGAVLFAIFFAVLNTMLMAARERTRDFGIMKALGFGDRRLGALMIAEAIVLVGVGTALGVLLAKAFEVLMAPFVAAFAPGFAVDQTVLTQGLAITLGLGIVSGVAPALRAMRLLPVKALREDN